MSLEDFRRLVGVSCETVGRLERYINLLRTWSRTVNLLGPREFEDIWRRHILDSAQIVRHIDSDPRTWLDIGSGAGFPGLVVAILMMDAGAETRFDLVDSDQRKCAFLREAGRILGLPVDVHAIRIENLPQRSYDLISARAFAPLKTLLGVASTFSGAGTQMLFHRGRNVEFELTDALKHWSMTIGILPSLSDPGGRILKVSGLRPVQ